MIITIIFLVEKASKKVVLELRDKILIMRQARIQSKIRELTFVAGSPGNTLLNENAS